MAVKKGRPLWRARRLQAAVACAVLVPVVVPGDLARSISGYFLAASLTPAAWGWCNCAWGSKAVSVPRLASA